VTFKNNVNLTGVIVTATPPEGSPTASHRIYFKNNCTINGVENLEGAQFNALRQMTGSAILAKGFELEFENNLDSVSGVIAAEKVILHNNLDGTIYGNIIIYGNEGLEFKNNSHLRVDHSRYSGVPAGFIADPPRLAVQPNTYAEGS
jgi:hypothetical protein